MSASTHAHPVSPVLEKRDGSIATLILNRPERLNAINKELAEALLAILQRIEADRQIRVVIITGAGRAFCAGGDLLLLGKSRAANDTAELEPMLRRGMQAVLTMRTMPQPVIAAVHGPAAGGGMNIALAADIRVASEDATFAQSFANVGLFPDYGGTFLLPQLIGVSRAAEMMYTGRMIDAQTALQFGIVNHVVPLAQLENEVQSLARKIAAAPPLVIQAVKRTLFASAKSELQAALEHEVQEQLKCFRSEDCAEGIRAFLEKRHPSFRGN